MPPQQGLSRFKRSNDAPSDLEAQQVREIRDEAQRKLKLIQARLEELEGPNSIEILERNEAGLEKTIKLCDSILSPIRHLPTEILTHIFLFTLPPFKLANPRVGWYEALDDSPWVLGRVSHRWRAVALNTPALWTSIIIQGDRDGDSESMWYSAVFFNAVRRRFPQAKITRGPLAEEAGNIFGYCLVAADATLPAATWTNGKESLIMTENTSSSFGDALNSDFKKLHDDPRLSLDEIVENSMAAEKELRAEMDRQLQRTREVIAERRQYEEASAALAEMKKQLQRMSEVIAEREDEGDTSRRELDAALAEREATKAEMRRLPALLGA